MNNCIFTGNLTRDVETKYTQSGKCVANFTIACNRPSSNKNEKQVDYIAVVAWEKLGELCDTYLSKGKKALVEGRLQIREYENSAGVKKKIAEIIARNVEFLSSKSSGDETNIHTGREYNNDGDISDNGQRPKYKTGYSGGGERDYNYNNKNGYSGGGTADDDDIPF